jgi:hypothetical protein
MSFSKCTYNSLTCSESDAEFTIVNSSEAIVQGYDVDGCLITKGKRCDFLFEVEYQSNRKHEAIYVELKKGWQLEIALEQIKETANHPSIKPRHVHSKRIGVVAGKPPIPAIDTHTQKLLFAYSLKIQGSIEQINSLEV